ncbi:hypothetical protein MVEN_01214600 [Mycena venus]|uniref:Uncharacterized protein n=1 Tax=Mycena venus TaxID=2733690 RepID=A0A8H7CY57_9AGAR|nr:hypothetical protein MVEN_01214600 [Mycena venus]
MNIHIILNPGAVGTPSNAQLSKKQKKQSRSGTPTSAELLQSSPGSGSATAIHRRSSLRAKSQSKSSSNEFTVGLGSRSLQKKKSYDDATPATLIHPIRQRHSSTTVRQPQPPASSPLVRQSRTSKRVVELELGFEGDAPPPPKGGRRRRGSTSTHSSMSSAGSPAAMFESVHSRAPPSRASLLLSRAKEHVALEAIALGRRSRSMMDVVMDLKGPAEEEDEDGVVMFIQDRSRSRHASNASYLGHDYLDASYSYLRRRGKNDSSGYVLTDDDGLAAYWEEQAAIWMHVDVGGAASGFHSNANANSDSGSDWTEVALTRFPMSMERSTAAWECP